MTLMQQQYLFPFLTAILGIVVTYIFSRQKNRAEIDKIQISNVAEVVKIYQTAMADLQKRVHQLEDELKALQLKLNVSNR